MGPCKSNFIFRISVFFTLLAIISFTQAKAETKKDPLICSYFIEIGDLSIHKSSFRAKGTFQIENHSSKELESLVFALYPNRFSTELPNLDDVNFRRIYPDGVSKGGLKLLKVSQGGTPLSFGNHPFESLPPNTFVKIELAKPLPPNTVIQIEMDYEVTVPEKYGSFGRFRNQWTLSGGWYPYLVAYSPDNGFQLDSLPRLSTVSVKITTDGDIAVEDHLSIRKEKTQTIDFTVRSHAVGLVIAEHFQEGKVNDLQGEARYIFTPGSNAKREPLEELLVEWFDFLHREPKLNRLRADPIFVFAPLREAMIVKGNRLIFISDRAFKVFQGLGQYHAMPILHALFYSLVIQEAQQREEGDNFRWVADAIAWHWVEKFVQEQAFRNVDARTLKPIHFFSFLYSIDRMIYAPQFAFYDLFYNLVYPDDPVRDDIFTFNHLRPWGRTIYAHMQDDLGVEKTRHIAERYLESGPEPITEQIPKASKWMQLDPMLNLKLGKIIKTKVDHTYEYDIPISKKSEKPWSEPVEIYTETEKGDRKVLVWNATENEKTFHLKTDDPLQVVEIDPRRRLLETHLSDNRSPPFYKVVLTEYGVNFDFNAKKPIGFVSGEFRRTYGGSNRYTFSGIYDVNSYGLGLGYTRLFGRFLDSLRLSHAIHLGYSFSRLAEDNTLVKLPGPDTIVKTGNQQFQSALSLSYFFGDQISITNPLRGGYALFGAAWGNSYMGGESNYYQAFTDASWILPFHPNHFVALRGMLGTSGPKTIPTKVQYSLGGISGIRGLDISDDRFTGKNILLLSAEYRHILFKDIDINLGLFRIRDIQGALFTDAGRVTDTVQEFANRTVLANGERTAFKNVFDVRHYSSDVGYGIRLLIDYLGVNPGILRFDAAKSISEGNEGIRFYFAVAQSF